MAKCKVSGKRPQSGNNRPWSKKATRRTWQPNIQTVSIHVPGLGRSVRVRLSARALRTVDRVGLNAFLTRQGLTLDEVI